MNEFSEKIRRVLCESNFNLSDLMLKQFVKYAELLVEWNQKMNLTAIIDPKEIAIKHFLDSLLVLDAYKIPYGASVIDVGTGAGFPGVPLKIVRPDINLTLLDSLNKRLVFLESLLNSLDFKAILVHERAEVAARKVDFREKFDVVVSRAVAPLNILLEYCVPFVKNDGVFVALKGSKLQEELSFSQNALNCLNADVIAMKEFSLITEKDRHIILFKKFSKVLNIYPRISSKIAKNPL